MSRPVEPVEDEYSYPPEGKCKRVDLTPLGVQVTKRPTATTRVYAAPLSDAAIARVRARAKTGAAR